MNGYYEYKIEYYDDLERKMVTHTGVVHAEKMSDAVAALEIYYGEESIENILWLSWVQEGAVLEIGEGATISPEVDNPLFDYSSTKILT